MTFDEHKIYAERVLIDAIARVRKASIVQLDYKDVYKLWRVQTVDIDNARIADLESALRDLLPYARACVPNPVDVGERNVIGRAEDLLGITCEADHV